MSEAYMKIQSHVIFIVLVYRNYDDLVMFIKNTKILQFDYKIVIVNSYYDEISKNKIHDIAKINLCDVIDVENKGYGYGNNCGIKYVNKNYNYKFIIISNPDIIIKKFDERIFQRHTNSIIAPIIHTKHNKHQNPYWYTRNSLSELMLYYGYKYRLRLLLYTAISINKLIRELAHICLIIGTSDDMQIYAAHGSFIIIPKSIIEKVGILYDENIFMFSEEAVLAHKLRRLNIKTYLTKNILICHNEDGSMRYASINEYEHLRKSFLYYYENYIIRKSTY